MQAQHRERKERQKEKEKARLKGAKHDDKRAKEQAGPQGASGQFMLPMQAPGVRKTQISCCSFLLIL